MILIHTLENRKQINHIKSLQVFQWFNVLTHTSMSSAHRIQNCASRQTFQDLLPLHVAVLFSSKYKTKEKNALC